MGKVLFITDTAPKEKTGTGVNGNMHKIIVNEIYDGRVINLYITSERDGISKNDIVVDNSSALEKIFAVISKYPAYLNARARNEICKQIAVNKISLVYVDNSVSGNLIRSLKKIFPQIKFIAFFRDIEIVKMADASAKMSLLRRITLPVLFYNEKCTAKYADATIVLNERDRQLYMENYGREPTGIVPICIPDVVLDSMDRKHEHDSKIKILFVGAEYEPNLNGIRWFQKEVAPLIKSDYEFNIVGRNMELHTQEFKTDHTNIIGTVDSLTPWYNNADVVIGPIFQGGGMKVKTAEALMHGKYFVGCSESLTGYWENIPATLKTRKIFKCDSPVDFASAIDELSDRDFCINDSEIHTWAKSQYSYESIYDRYKEIFDRIEINT